MIEFAVIVEEEQQGRWVLAVDPVGERVLVTNADDQALRWVPTNICRLIKAAHPEVPRPVVLVQPVAGSALAIPQLRMNGGEPR